MPDINSVVAICDNGSQAKNALKELLKAGFDTKKISIVGDEGTGRMFLICDGPWAFHSNGASHRRSRGRGTKMENAA